MADLVREVPLGTDWDVFYKMKRRNASTGLLEAAANVGPFTGYFSLTRGGSAIDAAVSVTVSELASAPGEYLGLIQAAGIDTHLGPLENQLIYEVITKAGDVMRSTPVRPVKWTSSE
jgi:hypothetical protein